MEESPTILDMLVCFSCSTPFRYQPLYALECHHLMCGSCCTNLRVCCQCRIPRNYDQALTDYILQWANCSDQELLMNQQLTEYVRRSLDFVLVPCNRCKGDRKNQKCPFDHSEYSSAFRKTVSEELTQKVKICERCKMRGPNESTKCVRCQNKLVEKVVRLMKGMQFEQIPKFSYFRNQGK